MTEKLQKRMTCRKCFEAGRKPPEFNVTDHKSTTCRYEFAERIEVVDLTIDDDDEPEIDGSVKRTGPDPTGPASKKKRGGGRR